MKLIVVVEILRFVHVNNQKSLGRGRVVVEQQVDPDSLDRVELRIRKLQKMIG